MAFAPEIFFYFFKRQQDDGAVKCEEIDMPGHRGEVVDVGERGVEEKITEQQREEDSQVDERVGDQIEDEIVALEQARERLCQRDDHGPFEMHKQLREQHPGEFERKQEQAGGQCEEGV